MLLAGWAPCPEVKPKLPDEAFSDAAQGRRLWAEMGQWLP